MEARQTKLSQINLNLNVLIRQKKDVEREVNRVMACNELMREHRLFFSRRGKHLLRIPTLSADTYAAAGAFKWGSPKHKRFCRR